MNGFNLLYYNGIISYCFYFQIIIRRHLRFINIKDEGFSDLCIIAHCYFKVNARETLHFTLEYLGIVTEDVKLCVRIECRLRHRYVWFY